MARHPHLLLEGKMSGKLRWMTLIVALTLVVFTLQSNLVFSADEPQKDISDHPGCPYCGMNRGQWAHSRMLIEYDDGTAVGLCSLRCAAVDMVNNIDKFPKKIGVGDYGTKALLDAETAVWVIGGDLPGVMTKRAKWAFKDPAAAEAFIKAHGGQKGDLNAAIEAAYDDINQDTKMIRERRKAKRMQSQPGGDKK
jgi:nitrous oxide reductase accessory protein NosL